MGLLDVDQVNRGLEHFVPELAHNKLARYPMTKHPRWLNFTESYQGKPTFIQSGVNDGVKEDYVYCKAAPMGKGYYHVLCKTDYVNLLTKHMSQGPPGGVNCGGCFGGGNKKDDKYNAGSADDWNTVRLALYARTRSSMPNDLAASEQQIDHYAGTKLNPGQSLKV